MGAQPPVLIAGAGICGLAAGLALARRGCEVRIFERASHLLEVGAGLQISPNASRILQRLGIVERLGRTAFQPESIRMVAAATGRQLAEMPLGQWAERRWGAPYLVAHRADLQKALLEAVKQEPAIHLRMGDGVVSAQCEGAALTANLAGNGAGGREHGRALIAADGVWSSLRSQIRRQSASSFSGFIAWRATLPASAPAARQFSPDSITVFTHRRFHLVAYPLRGGALINLVAVMRGRPLAESWEGASEAGPLAIAMAGTAVSDIAVSTSWTVWPIHEVSGDAAWTGNEGIALAGDAAHAMTPFAAQGAAMAIEDAAVLADCIAPAESDRTLDALRRYEALRKPRIARVARRAVLNRLAWHAAGPAALARNVYLEQRGGEKLATDLDWLYGANSGGQ